MHIFSKIFLTFIALGCLVGCSQSDQHKNAGSKADEKNIRDIVDSYEEAYNEQDAAKLVAQWAPDAIFINPVTGETAEGKQAIEELFRKKFAENNKRHLKVMIKSIEFPNANEAIENGVMKVSIDSQPALQIAYQAEYIRDNGKWFIQSLREIELQEPTSNFEHLKDLAWLVGKWKDSDDDVDITFDNNWDKYKNFITQHFTMKIYGQDDIEGKQIIAWDPVNDTVRSWVFDSDGGFGEGRWEKVSKSWYSTMRFTLGDGRVASSTNIYTPIDDHSYTYASVEREVDGVILSDINPVTVAKVE